MANPQEYEDVHLTIYRPITRRDIKLHTSGTCEATDDSNFNLYDNPFSWDAAYRPAFTSEDQQWVGQR